ncbi:hypothetical protein Vadar_004969 [Vaccinium darrowii]|uniref:Uncharacterized protein n=1 Tax=Vaccinium darrowii TaxID=229202 RepID=A0ACB7X857_9ERIC|nr:hypothetical protein Vadar_004969 [Vaccinium darrowii]
MESVPVIGHGRSRFGEHRKCIRVWMQAFRSWGADISDEDIPEFAYPSEGNLEPSVEIDTVANKKKQHEINVAISNSFGFGGHNSVVAFSAFKP